VEFTVKHQQLLSTLHGRAEVHRSEKQAALKRHVEAGQGTGGGGLDSTDVMNSQPTVFDDLDDLIDAIRPCSGFLERRSRLETSIMNRKRDCVED
jgi:hypothetical protein